MGPGRDDQAQQHQALPAFAGDADLLRLAQDGAALILVAANGMDVIWASPAGAQMIGAPGDARGFRFTTGFAPIERLAKLATETAPTEGARLERLRFVNGRQLSVVTVAARRGALPDGSPALLLTIAGQRGAASALPNDLAQKPEAKETKPETSMVGAAPSATPQPPPQGRTRFTFQMGQDGRLTTLAPAFLANLPEDAQPLKRNWSQLVDDGLVEPAPALIEALGTHETFQGLHTRWRSRHGVWLAVSLSATPIRDATGQWLGFRGFGVSQFTDQALPDDGKRNARALHAADASPAGGETNDDRIPQDATTPKPHQDEGRLSQNEREAFRQIARALGALTEPSRAASTTQPLSGDQDRNNKTDEQVQPTKAEPETFAPRDPVSAEANFKALQDDLARLDRDAPPSSPQPLSYADEDGIEEGEFIELGPTDLMSWPSASNDTQQPTIDQDSLAFNAARLLDRLPMGVIVSRGDVPIVMNRTLLDMLGYRDIDQFFEAGGLDAMFRGRSTDQIGMAAKGGDIALMRRDGGIIAAEARMQTIQWGDLPASLMMFRRPSDDGESASQATLELELRRREADLQELHAVLDTATDGIVMLDADGRIMAMNRSAEALFGYDQNEVAGEAFITLLAPESHAAAIDYIEGLRAGGVAAVLNDGRELLGRERQGGSIPLFTTMGRIGTAPDLKYCIVMRDITPWKKAEADLIAAKRAAELANAQKSDFLARMSHEIRTPMSAIMGFAEVMLDERFGPIGNERYRDYLKDMHMSGAHVISLINDLLDISKIEAGRADLTFIRLDLNDEAAKAAHLMENEARRNRVILRMNLDDAVPAIVADERSIKQIFLNLLSNAIKFSEAGGEVIVSTTLSERGEVVLRIRDTGIGMREEDIATALEPFRQVGTARRAGGTGLGLPLTKALVEANRASLSIRSAPDKGTLVEVIFPPNRVLAE